MVGNENKISNYYNISNGKVVKSFGATPPEGVKTQQRVNKNGNTVYEQSFDFIEAHIIDARMQSHEQYGDSLKLLMQKDSYKAELSIKFDSSYGRSFIFKIPNIDLTKELKITPYAFLNKEGKNIRVVGIQQEGEKRMNAYSKESPNGLPALKKATFNGKEQWDNTEQLKFLKDRFLEFTAKFQNVVAETISEKTKEINVDELDF